MVNVLSKLLTPIFEPMGVSSADLTSYLEMVKGYVWAIILALAAMIVVLVLAKNANPGKKHLIRWNVSTAILYGKNDELTSYQTISAFAREHNAKLTVMENGEHWFHTDEQMRFLDDWIRGYETKCSGVIISSECLRLYPASREQMEAMISSEQDKELKKAYSEILEGCLPDK